jgi:hypothetical protein
MNLLDQLNDMYSLIAHYISVLSPQDRANSAPKLECSHWLRVVLMFHFGKENADLRARKTPIRR